MQTIYLDHNATTPLLPETAEAMARAQAESWGNPASQHAFGRRARRVVEDARERMGEILGLEPSGREPDRLIFTSGGTEANNLALSGLGLADDAGARQPSHLVVSAVEHPAVLGAAARLGKEGDSMDTAPVDRDGCISVSGIVDLLRPQTRLVSVMLGNNETGVVQPIAKLAAACRERGVLVHTDAVQAVGKIDVHFRRLGVDALTLAAHKLHGPLGIGALAVRGGVKLRPLLVGGFQQAGSRPGTEAPALVVGLLTALEIWHRERGERTAKLAALRDDLQSRLCAACPEIVVHAKQAPRLPQTLNAVFPGVDRQAMFLALDQAGIVCSTGSACASGSSEPSATLRAMGCSAAELESSLRFSVGCLTTPAETASAAERILRVYNDLRAGVKGRKIGLAGRSQA